ncbi:MAG: HEAT repeat domain-containing protein [Thermoanaerobaculia bacterium]
MKPPEEPDLPRESPRNVLFQFVVFPLGIVVVGVAVFLLFGKLASEEHAIPDYLNDIRSGSSHERWQAAYQLSKSLKRGEAKRYPNLEQQVASIYVAAKHDDPRIRRYLSMVLGNLGDRRATPLLIDALQEPDVETRIYALLALGELRDPTAVPAMMTAASDQEKDVRKTALYALGAIGDPRAVPLLVQALDDSEADVRFNAAVGLSRFGDPRAIGVLREMMDRDRLSRVAGMREDQKEDAMIVAISAYARLAGPGAAADLEKLTRDSSLRVQEAAREALSKR